MTENFSLHPASKGNSYKRLVAKKRERSGSSGTIRKTVPYAPGIIGLILFSAAASKASAGTALAVGLAAVGVVAGTLGYYQEKYESKVEGREFSGAQAAKKGAVGFCYGVIGHYSPDKERGVAAKMGLRAFHIGLAVVTMGVLPAAKMCNRILVYRDAIKKLENNQSDIETGFSERAIVNKSQEAFAQERYLNSMYQKESFSHPSKLR